MLILMSGVLLINGWRAGAERIDTMGFKNSHGVWRGLSAGWLNTLKDKTLKEDWKAT